MDWINAAWLLTGLAAVVVLLTRVRLGGVERTSGVSDMSGGVVLTHTAAGVVALLAWVGGLAAGSRALQVLGVAGWWVVMICGLMLLARWLPSTGRHADDKLTDSWGEGAGLSALAHLGMVVGVGFFTFVVLTGRV